VVLFLATGFESVIGTVLGGGDGSLTVKYGSGVLGMLLNVFSFIVGDNIESKELLGVKFDSFDCYENSNE
jgi:hypothetical protein